jgi:hypothetical protein
VKLALGALSVLLAAVLAGCGSGGNDNGNGTTSTSSSERKVLVQLQEQSFSGEAGTATLTAQGDKTRVDILMASYAANAQPTHIHKGTCAKLDPTPAYPLHNLVVGKSVTVVPISLDALLKGKYAINVHRSAKQLKVYVACGDISEHAAPIPTDTTGEEGSGG